MLNIFAGICRGEGIGARRTPPAEALQIPADGARGHGEKLQKPPKIGGSAPKRQGPEQGPEQAGAGSRTGLEQTIAFTGHRDHHCHRKMTMQKARHDFSAGLEHSSEGYPFVPEFGFNV
jgi:hypothetical protein